MKGDIEVGMKCNLQIDKVVVKFLFQNLHNPTFSFLNLPNLKLRASQDYLQERQQQQSTEEVNLWLKTVRKVEDQVDTTKYKYENRWCCLFNDSSLNFWLAYKCSKKAAQLLEEMLQLETERNAFNAIA